MKARFHVMKEDKKMKIYNCKKVTLYTPKFITNNYDSTKHKEVITVDTCIADEIKALWKQGIQTRGCCCGHGGHLGFIQVDDKNITDMEKLGYTHYIYDEKFGGAERKDAFIPKSYGHNYDGYSDGFLG